MKRLIILNPQSRHGKAARDFERILPGLQKRLGEGFEVRKTTAAGHATEIVRSILQEDTELRQVLVAGGDGTINEAVNGYFDENGKIIRQDIPLGVINLGTGGDFFRTITNLSDNYETAISENRFSLVDYGEVKRSNEGREHRFINISSVGLAGEMLENLKRSTFQAGAIAYFYHTIKTLLGYHPKPVEIEYIDEHHNSQRMKVDLINLFVCNGQCSGGGMKWAPDAELASGLFNLTLISGRKKLPLITNSTKVYAGKISEFPGAQQMQASEMTIRYREGINLEADGEIIPPEKEEGGESEIQFRLKERIFPLVI